MSIKSGLRLRKPSAMLTNQFRLTQTHTHTHTRTHAFPIIQTFVSLKMKPAQHMYMGGRKRCSTAAHAPNRFMCYTFLAAKVFTDFTSFNFPRRAKTNKQTKTNEQHFTSAYSQSWSPGRAALLPPHPPHPSPSSSLVLLRLITTATTIGTATRARTTGTRSTTTTRENSTTITHDSLPASSVVVLTGPSLCGDDFFC